MVSPRITVCVSGNPLPKSAGSRKYIQKMTIRSGIPRMALMTSMIGQLIHFRPETLSSPRMSPPKKDRMQEATARYMVSPSPPSGPSGQRPTMKYTKLSEMTWKLDRKVMSGRLVKLEDPLVVLVHNKGDDDRDHKVYQGRSGECLEPLEGIAFHLTRLIGQFHDPDCHGQRRVFRQVQELVYQRGDRYPYRLREYDVLHASQVGETAALRRLHLLFRDREDPGADILCYKCRCVDRKGDESGGKFEAGLVQPFVDDCREKFVRAEVPEEYLDQERSVSGKFKKYAGAPTEEPAPAHPHDCDKQPQQKGEDYPGQ